MSVASSPAVRGLTSYHIPSATLHVPSRNGSIKLDGFAALAAATATAGLVVFLPRNSAKCEGGEGDVDRSLPSDSADILSDATNTPEKAKWNNDFRADLELHKVDIKPVSRVGNYSSDTFAGSFLSIKNLATQFNKGGCLDRRLYEYTNKYNGEHVRIIERDPNAPKDCPSRFPGVAIREYDPNSSVHKKVCGKYDGFKEAVARGVGLKTLKELTSCELTPTRGWILNPSTPMLPGWREKPNKYRYTVWHKDGCDFDRGGPPKYGNPTEAAYRRELHAGKSVRKSSLKYAGKPVRKSTRKSAGKSVRKSAR